MDLLPSTEGKLSTIVLAKIRTVNTGAIDRLGACDIKEALDVLTSVLAFFSSALVYNRCSRLIGEGLKARYIERSGTWFTPAQGNALASRKPKKYSPVGAFQEST